MYRPMGQLICSDPTEKYQKIQLFKESKVLIGLNDDCRLEILEDKIKFNLAMIEHKFNSFLLQSLSNCCHYRGKRIQKDSIIILRDNDILEFWYYNQVWQYQFGFVKSSPNKNKDSKLKRIIQADNCFLENTLKCGICLEIFQRPVQIQQCHHTFCGHCMTVWINQQMKCPTCRKDIKCMTNIRSLDKLSQEYLRKHPEKAKSLESQQIFEQQNRFYYDGKQTVSNQYDEDQISDISSEDLEQLQVAVQQNQQQIQPQCKSCSSQYQNFICQPGQQHIECCNQLLPIRQLNARENAIYKLFCQVCKMYTCKYYYNKQQCKAYQLLSLQQWSSALLFGFQVSIPQVLLAKIQEYLKGLTLDYMLNIVIRDCVSKEQFYLEGSQKKRISNHNELLLSASPLCIRCMMEVLAQMILKFFELNQITQIQGLQNCQYGIHCQLFYQNDQQHNNSFNHFCRRLI